MAAPNSAYAQESLFIINLSGVQIEHLLALLQVDNNTHKARFYLDAVVPLVLTDGSQGIAGVIYPGTNNFAMHNIARQGIGRSEGLGMPSGGVILNDGGLNTLGIATINANNLLWANNVRFNVTYKSAWYVNTDQMGIQYRLVGAGSWQTHWIIGESLPQQQQVTSNRLFDPIMAPGQNMQARAVIVNAEGTYYSAISVVTLQGRVFQYDALFRTSACDDNGQVNVAFWVKEGDMEDLDTVTTTSSSTGIYFWKNIELTTNADSGWYMGLDEDKSFFVDSTGQVTHYQLCPVSPPIITLSVEDDVNGNMQVWATVNSVQPHNLTIVGRIDVDPLNATPAGENFTIVILQGQVIGTDANFSLARNQSVTYYWLSTGSTPPGYVINTQMPI